MLWMTLQAINSTSPPVTGPELWKHGLEFLFVLCFSRLAAVRFKGAA